MSNRKNYNSIVFLTTLSVYLGLVLVGGATPSVLAQAALTRDFDIKHEIVFEDDLDKKPDGEETLDGYAALYRRLFELAENFSERNRAALRENRYEFDCAVVFPTGRSGQTITCRGESGLFWGGFLPPLKALGQSFPHTDDDRTEQVRAKLVLSESAFWLKTSFKQDEAWQAEEAAAFYDRVLTRLKIERPSARLRIVYENTRIDFANNQFFIVTRLPRASIDALPAAEDAR